MSRKAINTKNTPTVGPYSPGVDADGFVFLSGMTPINPATGELVKGGIKEETRQCFVNLFQILNEAGLTSDDVQKVNVYLTNMADFSEMNEVYRQHFTHPYPARTTIGVVSLPMGARVEIEMIAKR